MELSYFRRTFILHIVILIIIIINNLEYSNTRQWPISVETFKMCRNPQVSKTTRLVLPPVVRSCITAILELFFSDLFIPVQCVQIKLAHELRKDDGGHI